MINRLIKLSIAISTLTLIGVLTSRSANAAMLYSITNLGSRLGFRDTVNNSGQVISLGKTVNAKGQRVNEEFLINSDGTRQELGFLPEPAAPEPFTQALAINNLSQVVGNSGGSAFAWTKEAGITRIGTTFSTANDINSKGQIVVDEGSPSRGFISFIYDLNTGQRENIPLQEIYTAPLGINEKGDVVGGVSDGSPPRAFLYSNGVSQDLNSLISPQSGWKLEFGIDINDAGQIIGNGMFNGEERSFLLTPIKPSTKVPEPSTYGGIFLVALGATLGLKCRDKS